MPTDEATGDWPSNHKIDSKTKKTNLFSILNEMRNCSRIEVFDCLYLDAWYIPGRIPSPKSQRLDRFIADKRTVAKTEQKKRIWSLAEIRKDTLRLHQRFALFVHIFRVRFFVHFKVTRMPFLCASSFVKNVRTRKLEPKQKNCVALSLSQSLVRIGVVFFCFLDLLSCVIVVAEREYNDTCVSSRFRYFSAFGILGWRRQP